MRAPQKVIDQKSLVSEELAAEIAAAKKLYDFSAGRKQSAEYHAAATAVNEKLKVAGLLSLSLFAGDAPEPAPAPVEVEVEVEVKNQKAISFEHGNREVSVKITGTEAWQKAGMSRVYITLAFSGAKLEPIEKLYEILKGGTKDDTVEVHGRTFGYRLGISCDSKTKRRSAVEAIESMLKVFAAPAPVEATVAEDAAEASQATAQPAIEKIEGSYISWGLNSDDVYDEDGDVIGKDEYILIEKLYIVPADRRQGKARAMLREALAEIAEKHPGMTVKVAALPFDGDAIDMSDLVAFYESEGFSIGNCDGHAVIMVL